MSVRVLLADDHSSFREAVFSLLETEPVEVVGVAGTGRAAVRKTRSLEPDLVLMDLSLPDIGGLEATRRITDVNREVRVLVLTVHVEPSYLRRALEAGAQGYLPKHETGRHLVPAIETISRGDVYRPP